MWRFPKLRQNYAWHQKRLRKELELWLPEVAAPVQNVDQHIEGHQNKSAAEDDHEPLLFSNWTPY